MSDSLFKYITKSGKIDDQLYDNLRYVLEGKVYYYGNHFLYPQEKTEGKESARRRMKHVLRTIYAYYKLSGKKGNNSGIKVLSNAYFTFNDELQSLGFNVLSPNWSFAKNSRNLFGNVPFHKATEAIRKQVFDSSFSYLISDSFAEEYYSFRQKLINRIVEENISALVVPNDVSFFENLAIQAFKELRKPSFIFLHGLPARYNIIDENRTDYLIVWGEKIKEHYINMGFSPEKILVGGHPLYKKLATKEVRSTLDNVLVLAKVATGSPHSDGAKLYDRGAQIVYLLQLQKALQKKGVKSVRLRFHPSANPEWHFQYIDKQFFIPDFQPLSASLKSASLVIGPSSTVLLESIYHGVNYLVFEPVEDGVSLFNEELVAPFNGKEEGVPFAGSSTELEKLLADNVKMDTRVFERYISPFDIGFIKEILS